MVALLLSEITIGQRLADLRREVGRRRGQRMTQGDLAKLVGVTRQTIVYWETDKQEPRGQNLVRLAQVLDTTPDYILGHPVTTPMELEPEALELFGNFDDVIRHLRGVAPPGQEVARKLAALEGIQRTAAALGWTIPEWFWSLEQQIRNGEL